MMGNHMRESMFIRMQGVKRMLHVVLMMLLLLCGLPSFWAISLDGEALLAFKAGLTQPGVLTETWVATNVDVSGCPQSSWYGVQTNTNGLCQVVGLNLSGLSLAGVIQSGTLGHLSGLVSLKLANNLLSGQLPDDLGTLTKLQDMDIAANRISGGIPTSLKGLVSLVNLSLADNQLTGNVSSVLNLPQLQSLNLSGNQLTGPLQIQPDMASKLVVLDLSGNQLSGGIPTNLCHLVNLAHLDLSSNAFDGHIPPEIDGTTSGTCTSLKFLDLSRNQLSGPIPTMSLLTSLTTLRLTDNSLTNELPPQLLDDHQTPMLEELDLSRNQLNGSLGPVTSKVLNVLKLASNRLTGTLPIKIQSCTVVDLSNNNFSDGIILSKWNAGLQTLDLSNNNLGGPLDNETWQQLFRLTTLNLSYNQLSGSVPPKLLTSPSITELALSHNQFTGAIPGDSGPLETGLPLQVLDLSNNSLSGGIPSTIGTYTQLLFLSLSANQLGGTIPSQLSSLSLLQHLDLSRNLLTGTIPAKLSSVLKYFNVSGNSLSGTVPSNLLSFSNSSFYPGNPNLVLPRSSGNASSSGVQVTLESGHKRGSLALKIGLIVGCTVGAALVAAASVLIYYRFTLKPSAASPVAVKAQQENKPTPDAAVDVAVGVEVPPVIPRGTSVKSALIAKARNDMKLDALDLQKSGESPMRTKFRAGGPPSSDDDSSISAEHPMVLKVRSPDRLAGDLFFLDASLLFTAEELSRAPAEVLGRSNHGTSYKATLDNGHVLTVKWLREGLAKNKKEFTREAKRFGGIKHPHVVSLRGYYWGPREHEKLLLSDYVSTGSLAYHLYERTGRRHSPLTWDQRLQVAVGIANGLSYLHNKHGVAHGNLKARNVLLQGPNLTARVADYSLHRLMTVAGTANQILNAGALGYRSPELAATRKPKPSLVADVYALGVILMELITGKGAGDIMSANYGAVDLPDWVKLVAVEGRPVDCFDPAIVGVHREQDPPKSMHEVLAIALSCMAPQATRPTVKCIYDQLVALTNA